MYLEFWWFLTVPIFFVIGWVASRWDRKKNRLRKQTKLKELEKLVLFLTEENHSGAVKLLQSIIKDYERSFHLQKALGIMFRRLGLFDRALEIHAALLSMRKVDSTFLDSILIDLSKDYIGAGLYDKAYQALELIENETYYYQTLELRLKINQRLKQWNLALKTLKDLESYCGEEYENLRIHFFCELIENGAEEYKKKLKEKNPDHRRAKELLSNKNIKISLEHGDFICNCCATKFDYFFWKCHLCETWDSCERLSYDKN